MRVQADDDEPNPPERAVRLLRVLGELVHQRSAPVLPGTRLLVHPGDGLVSSVAFAPDPELSPITTEFGPLQFVAVVGVSRAMLEQLRTSSTEAVIDAVRARNHLLVVGRKAVPDEG
jgi:hypothetical protein